MTWHSIGHAATDRIAIVTLTAFPIPECDMSSDHDDAKTDPQGDLLLRTMAMPADTNPNGDIFGGWLMAQMDIAAGILAKEIAGGRVVTVAVNEIVFRQPVKVGNVVCCYGRCMRIGNTSMTIDIEVWVKPVLEDSKCPRYLVTEAVFTYVAIDEKGRPRKVKGDD